VHAPAPATVYWPTFGPGLYRAGLDAGVRAVTFAIRSDRAGDASFINEVRAAVWAVNASLPVAGMRTLQEIFDETLARTSFTLVMLTLAAGAALTLGLLGIYGVISYSVSQRTREIGIRVALGAAQGKLILMFLRDGVALAGIGIVMGLGAAAGLAQVMSRVVFGVSPLDPVTYSAVPLVLLLAAMLASYLPARRAAAIQPSEALKQG
jgi:ABC-type antimicrobial peptide transport system permease subunit